MLLSPILPLLCKEIKKFLLENNLESFFIKDSFNLKDNFDVEKINLMMKNSNKQEICNYFKKEKIIINEEKLLLFLDNLNY